MNIAKNAGVKYVSIPKENIIRGREQMSNLTGRKRQGTNQNRPKKYNTKKAEQRGKTQKEPRAVTAFWKDHTMDELMTKTQDELAIIVAEFIEYYEAKQIAVNRGWWYPEDMASFNTLRKKTKSKYKAEPFN